MAGSVLLNGANAVFHEVREIKEHENYSEDNFSNDICLIRVETQFVESPNVRPIKLGKEFLDEEVTAVASGWGGTTAPGGRDPNNLQWMVTETISNAVCFNLMEKNSKFVVDSKVCTYTRTTRGTCQGDSGGPLTANGELVGILSWNIPCGRGFPDGFERISTFYDWIENNAKD